MALSREKRVGLTVLLALTVLGILVAFLGRMRLGSPGYTVLVDFRYVDSLKPLAPVLYGGGVKVGEVDHLAMVEGKVRVKLHIYKAYQLPKNSVVTIHTSGILGEKYVQISAGDIAMGVVEKNTVIAGLDPGSLDRTLQKVEALTDFLEPLLTDPKFKKGVHGLLSGLSDLMNELSALVKDSSGDVRAAVKNLREMSEALRGRADEIKGILKSASGMINDANKDKFNRSLTSLDATLAKLDKALAHMDEKKGPMGMMMYDDETAQDLRELLRDLKKHPWKLLWKK